MTDGTHIPANQNLMITLFCFMLYLQIVDWERAPTPGSLRLAKAFPTSHCVTPSLIRLCLNFSANASSSLEKKLKFKLISTSGNNKVSKSLYSRPDISQF